MDETVSRATDDERSARETKKAQSRRRILESAREVFFRDGFMAANLDEVADKAGVAKGTLYRYFESKAELYVAVLAENGAVFTSKMREAADSGADPIAQLDQIASFYLEHWTRHREYFQIFWAVDNQAVIGHLPPTVVDEVTKLWEQCLSILNDVLNRGVQQGKFRVEDTWATANILWSLANALIQSENTTARRALRKTDLEQIFNQGMQLIIKGITAG